MSILKNFFCIFFLLLVIFLIYRNWFLSFEIIGGDWPYIYQDFLRTVGIFPSSWSSVHGNGLGGKVITYSLDTYLYLTASLFSNFFKIPWQIVYKIFWFSFFILLSSFSSAYLFKKIFLKVNLWQLVIAAILYTSNTYILMVVGGGQMGVALAYSIAPFVLGSFIDFFNLYGLNICEKIKNQKSKVKNLIQNLKLKSLSLVAGVVFGIQLMFDVRIAYITLIAVVLCVVFNVLHKVIPFGRQASNINKFRILSMFYAFVTPIIIGTFLNIFWILPFLLFRFNPLSEMGAAYTTVESLKFFSFANFSDSISFLHPNWPENIFGKVYFMRPEFIVLPILAFMSLLFINDNTRNNAEQYTQQRRLLFFALLGLVGAFLTKGSNPPFGAVYVWMFEHIPGFIMFRDPTKFYLLIALSYSILIPFTIGKIYKYFNSKFNPSIFLRARIQNFSGEIFLIFAFLYLLFLIRPAIFGQLGGTFQKHEVPKEYIELKDFLKNQPDFFRTLWVPKQQRFTYADKHPVIEAQPLFNATNSAEIIRALKKEKTKDYLSRLSIKYIIIPYDSLGEIFVDDRKYSQKKRIETEKLIDSIGWIKKIKDGQITVYENESFKDHFQIIGDGKILSYWDRNTERYFVKLSVKKESILLFLENYNPYWVMRVNNNIISSKKTEDGLNSFSLGKVGDYEVEIYFTQEKVYKISRIISVISFMLILIILFMLKSKKFLRQNVK